MKVHNMREKDITVNKCYKLGLIKIPVCQVLSKWTNKQIAFWRREMETKHPSMLDLLLETHIGLERQGPGSSEAIEQALGFLKPLNKFSRIADLGCGTGGQTIHLAQHLPGTITGLDMFADFIEKLNENAKIMNLGNRVTGIVGSMEDLPFQKNSLDLIWSEGAIEAAISRLLEKYACNETMIEYAAQNRYETELYSKFNQYYGYVFYIGRAI